MRLGATSPMISIDPENEAVNWLWYCSPAYRDEDYLPAARARPGGDALAAAQWRAWQGQLWAGVRRDPSRFRLGAVPSWGTALNFRDLHALVSDFRVGGHESATP